MLIQLDKVLNGHVFNVKLEETVPNGAVVEKGAYVDYDVYEGNTVADVDGELLFVVSPFLDETGLEEEINYTLKKGKKYRAYQFGKGDAITVTIDGIDGATNVAGDMVGKFAIAQVGSPKLTINNSKAGSLVFEVKSVEQLDSKDALHLEVK